MENLKIVATMGEMDEIGYNNKKLWEVSEDEYFLKSLIKGKYVIVGYNSFMSLSDNTFIKSIPLVLTHKKLDLYADAICYDNYEDILNFVSKSDNEFIVIGGSKVYDEFLPYTDTMYLTTIRDSKRADKFFPYFDLEDWNIETIKECNSKKNAYIRNKYVRKRVK